MKLAMRYSQLAIMAALLSVPAALVAQPARIAPKIRETKDSVFVTIDVPGSTLTCALGISPNGAIVGVYTTDPNPFPDCLNYNPRLTGFLLEGDHFTDLRYPVPPGPFDVTIPMKINARGTIVGFWVSQPPFDSVEGGWVWEKGKFSEVKYAGAVPPDDAGVPQITDVFGISSSGDMSGGVAYLKNRDDWNGLHGWFYDANKRLFETFYPNGCYFTVSYDINDRGEIAGRCEPRQGEGPASGFVRSKEGIVEKVPSVPASWSAIEQDARGINSEGVIIGSYLAEFPGWPPVSHGYILSKGLFTPIDPPDALASTPWGINPAGIIVGSYGMFENGMPRLHGFVRIPKRGL